MIREQINTFIVKVKIKDQSESNAKVPESF